MEPMHKLAESPKPHTLIEFLHVRKDNSRGEPVFRDANLQICKGDFVLLTGPAGSGKTTILKLISGLESSDGGHVLVEGQAIQEKPPAGFANLRSRMGIVLQDQLVMPRRTVFENVALHLELAGKNRRTVVQGVEQVLRSLGLMGMRHSICGKISVRERYLVALGRAAAASPVLLLVDEPTCAFDEPSEKNVSRFIERLHMLGTTIVIATTSTTCAYGIPQARLISIRDGMTLESGSAHAGGEQSDLTRNPRWTAPRTTEMEAE